MSETFQPIVDEDVCMDWRLWCRLCAKDDTQNVNVFLMDEEHTIFDNQSSKKSGNELSLGAVIQKYFNVQIKREEKLPQMLCSECFSLVTSLVNFVDRVEKVQAMYNDLQNLSVCNPHKFRLKYGLLDRSMKIKNHSLTEVHYADVGANLYEMEENICGYFPPRNVKIKKEYLAKDELQTEEADIYGSEHTDEELSDPFAEEKVTKTQAISDVDEVDLEDNRSLAIFRKTLNSRYKFSADQTPKQIDLTTETKTNDIPEIKLAPQDVRSLESEEKPKSLIHDCSECHQQFKRIKNYRKHLKRKHNSTSSIPHIRCDQCSSVFKTQYNLKRHLISHLPLNEKRVNPCPYCDRKFTTKSFVTTHVKIVHLNERSFICEECGDACQTRGALREHMLTHTDHAPFECDVCHKRFKNLSRLKNHKEIHDENKHICAECGLQLNSRITLNRHLLVHTDKMQHKCDYCGRAFKRAKTLKSHLILHTGLKPYSCDFCERTFASGSNCRTHKKKAHPKELAELEASGGKAYTKNIPKIEALKAVTKTADNLLPVVSKHSGNFSLGRKPQLSPSDAGTVRTKPRLSQKQPKNSNDITALFANNDDNSVNNI